MRNQRRIRLTAMLCLGMILLSGCVFDDSTSQSPFGSDTSIATDIISSAPFSKPVFSPPATDSGPIEASDEPGALLLESVEGVSDSELIDYFCEVALNVEYGEADGILKRWKEPIRVMVSGEYTRGDMAVLKSHIEALNRLDIMPHISIVDSDANFLVYFIPLDEMEDTIPGYVEGNWGYFFLSWDGGYVIQQAYMGIAADVTTQEMRNHLILEEFTQSLGLMNDSEKYPDSIFQAEFTQTQSLADIDFALLRMLYGGDLQPGMLEPEVRKILNAKIKD